MFSIQRLTLAAARLAILCVVVGVPGAHAARVGVLSNKNAAAVAADFAVHIPAHTFTAVDVSGTTPAGDTLIAQFDVILLFEDGIFEGSQATGNAVYQFANAGHPVVLSTFYDQDRSDRTLPPLNSPHGWGQLETIDPNTTDGVGTSYALRTLDTPTIVHHPLTLDVHSLYVEVASGPGPSAFAGGNQAKPGTRVVAAWTQKNLNNNSDPAIAYRVTGRACVVHIGIAADYPSYFPLGTSYGGDFYQVWKNAFDYGAGNCGAGIVVPTLASPMPWALGLLLALGGVFALRRRGAA